MFCKWCGKLIQTTDECCPECGRQTPAMSDCGGLYDLKHTVAAVPVTPPTAPTSTKCPLVDKLEARYEKDRSAAGKHHTAMLAGFAVVLVVLLISLAMSVLLTMQVIDLKNQIDLLKDTSASQSTEPSADPDPSDTGDPSGTENPGETEDPDETEDPGETEAADATTAPTDKADPTEATQAEDGTV